MSYGKVEQFAKILKKASLSKMAGDPSAEQVGDPLPIIAKALGISYEENSGKFTNVQAFFNEVSKMASNLNLEGLVTIGVDYGKNIPTLGVITSNQEALALAIGKKYNARLQQALSSAQKQFAAEGGILAEETKSAKVIAFNMS